VAGNSGGHAVMARMRLQRGRHARRALNGLETLDAA